MAPTKTMKAARFRADTKKVAVEVVPIPRPGDDEMLVRTIGSGLCHSDMMVVDGTAPFLPDDGAVTIGHEAVGEVVEVGSDVPTFGVGDKVGFLNGLHACWECEGCRRHYGFCRSPRFRMQGFAVDGFIAEYCLVDPKAAFRLPPGIDVVKTAPLCCAGITAYNGVKEANLQPGEWLAVVGCGGLGQLALRYAKAMGLKAIGVDIDDSVLATAQKAGVDGTVNSRTTPNVADQIKKIIGDADDKPVGGADAVVVFTAVKAGYDLAPSLIKVGGVLVVVGCPPEISFNAVEVALGKYSIRGANNHGTPEMLRECADFTAAHAIESPVQLFRIDQVGEMIDRMEEGKLAGNRLVVDFSQNT